LEEDAPLSNHESALPQIITRRVLWRVAQSQYDPLGLLSVYMVIWKLLMRRVTLKGKGGGWESPLDKEEEDEFRRLLRDLNELREIRFPRCVQPLEGPFKKPLLMVFGDRSREACCTLVYLRSDRDDGTACCRLVTGKTQVAPKVKITIPRMELVAAVNSVRLAKKTRVALKIPLMGIGVLHGFVGCPRHAQNRVWQIQRVRRGTGKRGQGEQQCRRKMEVAGGEL
jgi:hypothetical protein